MLQKLQNIGVDGIELAWFRNYLRGHMQCVAIGKARSSLKPISGGVPQGSILGPLLFIIFMNNLPAVVSSCDIQLPVYADDTIVYSHGKTADEVKQKLTVGFQTVVQWFQQNCLTVNIKKTHVSQHIDSVSKKVSRSLAVLRRISKHLTLKTIMVLYNAVVLPHLDYCLVAWQTVLRSFKQTPKLWYASHTTGACQNTKQHF